MNRQSVKSSNIKSIGWENNTLEIEFFRGIYQYKGVPKHIYDLMMKSPSKGKFLHSIIIPKYSARRIK